MRYFFIFSLLFLFSCENASIEEKDKDVSTTSETSDITCPKCGSTETEVLPTDQCLLFYDCKHCDYTMTPEGDDCCVFCTHGDHKCPSMQTED